MPRDVVSPPPAPPPAGLPPALPRLPQDEKRSGCLKWGLIGCIGLSVLLIVGLVFLGMKAQTLMERVLRYQADTVVNAATPDVNAAEKKAFQTEYDKFIGEAKAGRVGVSRMRAVSGKISQVLADGKVDPSELRSLTEEVSGRGQ